MSKRKSLFAFAALAFILCGCEEPIIDSPIVDWNPVNIYIYATDSQGNSIIQPDMPGMSLTFQGKTYTVRDAKDYYDSIRTKAYFAVMRGLLAEPVDTTANPQEYRLRFGEIDGAVDMDEDITLNWPDGTTDVIHYHCSDHNESKITVKRSWKLNGKDHDGGVFHFSNKSLKPVPVATLTDQGYSDGNLYYAITSADNHEVQVKGYHRSKLIDAEGFLGIPSKIRIDSTEYQCTSIQDSTFFQCDNLAYLDIPESVTEIGKCAFFECTRLTSVTIPEGVTEIKDETFYGCENMTSVILSDSIKSIGAYAFKSCAITSINIPEGVTSIGEGAFMGSKLTSFSFPQSITFIDENTLAYCYDLTSVTIPSSITSIGERAFKGALALRSIICKSITPPSIITDFSNVNGSFDVFIFPVATVFTPAGLMEIYKNDDDWKNFDKFEELQW